jgi:hypothetical protein
MYFHEVHLNLNIINCLYEVENCQTIPNEIINKLKDNSNNQMVEIKETKENGCKTFKWFDLNVIDCLRSKFRCRSRYERKQYASLLKFVKEKYELLYYIKTATLLSLY